MGEHNTHVKSVMEEKELSVVVEPVYLRVISSMDMNLSLIVISSGTADPKSLNYKYQKSSLSFSTTGWSGLCS